MDERIKFYVDGSWLRDKRDQKLLTAFHDLFIIRAEYRWDLQKMEYIAYNYVDDQIGDVDIMVRLSPMCEVVGHKIVPFVEFPEVGPNDEWRYLSRPY
jgi:hypothetical protein